MKIQKSSLLFFLTAISLTCGNKRKVDNNKNINNTLQTNKFQETRKYADSVYYTKVPILLDRLKSNGYKFPNKNEFRATIFKLFNIDVDTAHFDEFIANTCQGPNQFVIFKNDGFILHENFDSTNVENLKIKITRDKDMFFQLNNYLFNNSVEARFLLAENKPKSLTELLFNYGYPIQDTVITDIFLKDKDFESYSKLQWSELFCKMSDCEEPKILGIKEDFVTMIADKYPNTFRAGSQALLYPNKLDEKIDGIYPVNFSSLEVRNKCQAYILNVFDSLNITGEIDAFFVENMNLFKTFKDHDYYGFQGLKEYCKYAEKMTKEQLSSGKYDN